MPTGNDPTNQSQTGWSEWSKHVLLELQRLNEGIVALEDKISEKDEKRDKAFQDLRIEVEMLKVKHSFTAGMWGIIGGFLAAGVTTIIYLLQR